jgi:hypothetical protein
VVQRELWYGNIQNYSDQGVAILVVGQVNGKETTLLRFNCFDVEHSYVYGKEADLGERHKILQTMLDAVYVDTFEENTIVAIQPKSAFQALFR